MFMPQHCTSTSINFAPSSEAIPTTFVSQDDKHTVKVGEHGYPVVVMERGKTV